MAQKARVVKALKAMQSYGISEATVKPVLKNLLDLYDKNWKLIEDENYRVLLEAIFDIDDSKREEETRNQEYHLVDEPEETELSPLKTPLRSQNNRSSPSHCGGSSSKIIPSHCGGSSSKLIQSPTFSRQSPTNSSIIAPCKKEGKKSDFPQKNELQLPGFAFSPNENMHAKSFEEGTYIDVDGDGTLCDIPLAVFLPAVRPSILGEENSSIRENLSDAQEKCSESHELVDRKEKSSHDGRSNEEISKSEANALEITSLQREDDGPKPTKIDVASSLNGEVKIVLIHNASNQSSIHNRSVKSVLKAVEEKYVKSYGITKPGFSFLNMMKDVCEFFLLDNSSNDNEQAGPININSLNFSNGSLKLHIPKSLTSGGFEFLQSNKGIDVNSNVFSLVRDKNCQGSSSSRDMAITHSHSPYYYVDDITKGEEEKKISLVNEINDEEKPNFCYIPRNIKYRNAYVKFILARISDDNCCSNCTGDCTSRSLPCACAGETGGEFAYTQDGLVKEKLLEECISMNRDPQKHNLIYCKDCPLERAKGKKLVVECKGHLVRSFIKECWYKCGCSYNCGNRVVQRSITVNLQVFMTPEGKGWGLRTLEELPKGAFVCEYVGEIVTNTELFERNNNQNKGEKHTYPVLLDADWGSESVLKDEEALCLDATFCGNVARFVNHRCGDANMVEIPVEVETPDHHYYHLAFFTTRKVNALEELTWDYGVDFNDRTHPVKAFQCVCGSKLCRSIKRRKRNRSSW